MTEVLSIVRDALQHLRVVDANASVPNDDLASGIASLNRMLRAWEADGIALGWSDVSAGDDDMPTPPEADEAIGYNLAVRLRARYGVTLDPDVAALATSGVSLLRALSASSLYSRCSYEDLPAGTGQLRGNPRSEFGF